MISENDIFFVVVDIFLFFEKLFVVLLLINAFVCFLDLLQSSGSLCFFDILSFKFFILDAFKSVEILSVQLIQLGLNPLDGFLDFWNDHELESIYSSIGKLEFSLESGELCLQRSNVYEKAQIFLILLLGFHDSLTTSSESEDAATIITVFRSIQNERWLHYTSHILDRNV